MQSVASSIYTMSHNMMIPLSTRDLKQRAELSALSTMSGNALAGTLSGVLIPLLVLPAIGIDRESWTVMACVVSILALPLTLLEYYYTRERVTEEDGESRKKFPYRKQIKACMREPYMVLILAIYILTQVATQVRNTSLLITVTISWEPIMTGSRQPFCRCWEGFRWGSACSRSSLSQER